MQFWQDPEVPFLMKKVFPKTGSVKTVNADNPLLEILWEVEAMGNLSCCSFLSDNQEKATETILWSSLSPLSDTIILI